MSVNRAALLLVGTLFFNGFEREKAQALDTLRAKKATIQRFQKQYSPDMAETLSIVFPEVMRYNAFKDFFEMQSLEWIYAHFGKEKADFSVGMFQMKPSFIEKLEKYAQATPSVSAEFSTLFAYNTTDETAVRQERVRRLKDFEWQLRYALAFRQVCAARFADLHFDSQKEKIKFFAAAYNFGFDADVSKIEQWTTRKVFPYGAQYGDNQLSYSELAADFLTQNAHEFIH